MKPVDKVTKAWIKNKSDELAVANGCRFSMKRARYAVEWIEANCYLHEGVPAGTRMTLDDWQLDLVMRLFGWVRPLDKSEPHYDKPKGRTWVRRFRRASVWLPKKNAKSPTAAAIALYLLTADGESGQNVYTSAKDGKQALIVQGHAINMVRASPNLRPPTCSINASTKQIFHADTLSKMVVVAGDNERSQEGLNGSVIVDECFVAGTKISTPYGFIDIDKVRPGHLVYNALGVGVVSAVSLRHVKQIYMVELSDGTQWQCTGNHRVFTARGWRCVAALGRGEIVYSIEAVRSLRNQIQTEAQGQVGDAGRGVWTAEMLLNQLLKEAEKPNAFREDGEEVEADIEAFGSQTSCSWRQWDRINHSAIGALGETRTAVGGGVRSKDLRAAEEPVSVPDVLQTRYSSRGTENRNRGRRPVALHAISKENRCEESGIPEIVRVERVSRIECESARTVFNLQVCGHPSYFAEGKLVHNCHVVDKALMKILKGAGISRAEPLHLEVSTAGNDPDSYGKEQFDKGMRVQEGLEEDQSLLFIAYAAPQDLKDSDLESDPMKYIKMANPALGRIVNAREILDDYNTSKRSLSALLDFKMYRLNIWQNAAHPWMKVGDWAACKEDFNEEAFRGKSGPVGGDFARLHDMTAFVLTTDHPDGTKKVKMKDPAGREYEMDVPVCRILPRFWMAEQAARDHPEMPFMEWAEAGLIILTPGNTIDPGFIMSDFLDWIARLNFTPTEFGFDPSFGSDAIVEMICDGVRDKDGNRIRDGCGAKRVEFAQNWKVMTEPTELFEGGVLDGVIRHNNNPVMNWQIAHTELRKSRDGELKMPQKPDGKKEGLRKIDGVMAALFSYARFKRTPPQSGLEIWSMG